MRYTERSIMYLTADTITLDDDDGRFTLVIEDDEGTRHSFIIHHVDLDTFYNQVRGRLGPYLREMHEARSAVSAGVSLSAFLCAPEDVDESGGFATRDGITTDLETGEEYPAAVTDPKHPRYHSTHADLWDSREGK
jgi:hypothetical protein